MTPKEFEQQIIIAAMSAPTQSFMQDGKPCHSWVGPSDLVKYAGEIVAQHEADNATAEDPQYKAGFEAGRSAAGGGTWEQGRQYGLGEVTGETLYLAVMHLTAPGVSHSFQLATGDVQKYYENLAGRVRGVLQ